MEVWLYLSGEYISQNAGENPETLHTYVVSIQINTHPPLFHCAALGESFHSFGPLSSHPTHHPECHSKPGFQFQQLIYSTWKLRNFLGKNSTVSIVGVWLTMVCLSECVVGWGLEITAKLQEKILESLRRIHPLKETSGRMNRTL